MFIRNLTRGGDSGMSDMNKTVGSEVLLTSSDVRRWQEELQKQENIKAAAETRIEEIRKKLDAAALLSGTSFPQFLADNPAEIENEESMAEAATRLLGGFQRAITHQELQTSLRAIPKFREMLEKNKGAYYYTMVRRLLKSDPPKLRKVGKKIRLAHRHETPPGEAPEGAQ
jgi:hypothetical protein